MEECLVLSATELDELNATASTQQAQGAVLAHTGTVHAQVTPGGNDKIMLADSGQTAGVKWGTATSTTLAADSVTATQIAAGAVGTSELADDSVTPDKMEPGEVRLQANGATRTENPVTWDVENADPDGYITVPSSTVTVPTGKGGLHIICVAFGTYTSYADTLTLELTAGGQVYRGDWDSLSLLTSPTGNRRPVFTIARRLAAGDTITLDFDDTGSGSPIYTIHLTIVRVSD